jgi:dTDP-4-dehydrorhamnose reductase
MKIVLLGARGQLGMELQRSLLPLGPLTALDRTSADLADQAQLLEALTAAKPDVIVNAAAYTAVDRAESEPQQAHRINGQAVGEMAAWARAHGALFVHYSTDYVFDGSKPTPYVETDATAPVSVYGASKLAGEQAIARSGCPALIFRTSWVFSRHGANFIRTILRLAAERDSLRVVADQFGAPTSAELIADVTAMAILAHRSGGLASGIYHLVPGGQTSFHQLATYVVTRSLEKGAALKTKPTQIAAIGTQDYPLPAKRPANSRMDNGRLSRALGVELPDWQVHVERLLNQLLDKPAA